MNQRSTKKIAVILNGSGHRDGSEIHEAVLTLLGIEEAGATWEVLALSEPQARVVNHVTGKEQSGKRDMLEESARIARGRIKNLSDARAVDYDAVIIPGGSGTAANLCDFATRGAGMNVHIAVARFLEDAHKAGKPIGAVCIAPMILARVFGRLGVTLTLGDEMNDAAKAARELGCQVKACDAEGIIVDRANKLVTTPAYMTDAGVAGIAKGIRSLAREIVAMTNAS